LDANVTGGDHAKIKMQGYWSGSWPDRHAVHAAVARKEKSSSACIAVLVNEAVVQAGVQGDMKHCILRGWSACM
jgi:hypothetical protein